MQEAMDSLTNGISTIGLPNPELNLDWFTCGLLNYIPLEQNTLIFTGGLLFDAYYAHVHQTQSTYDLEELRDIDLFLMGTKEKKIQIVQTIFTNLKEAYGESRVVVGVDRAVISIYIAGLPRIVQIICTNYEKAEQVIDNFDMAHVAMYYSDKGFFPTPFAKLSVNIKRVLPNPKCSKRAKPARLIKYQSRGMDVSEYIKEFPFNVVNHEAVYKKERESLYYRQTKNFTVIGDKNLESECESDDEGTKAQKMFDGESMRVYLKKKFGIQLLKISNDNLGWVDHIEWSGDFEYLQPKENFLSESNQLQIDSQDCGEFYTAVAHKTPGNSSKKFRNIYSDLMVTGKLVHVIKEAGGMSEYFYYLIWTVQDPDTIELIKQVVAACVSDLAINENSKEFYETCILDSQALSPEERVLYNVENFPHDKYSNAELKEKIAQCVNLPELCLFAPIYPEKFHSAPMINDDEKYHYAIIDGEKVEVSKNYAQSIKLDKFFQDKSNTDVCIITKVKNIKTGGKSLIPCKDKRARTCFAISYIF